MSHQTGIRANIDLLRYFSKLTEDKIRLVKITIENDELKVAESKKVVKDFERDYEKYVTAVIEDNVPCYILFRLDFHIQNEWSWLLLSWVPETATIRHKMLYASTKATLKSEFGSAKIKEEIHATQLDEITLNGYHRYKSNANAPAPLTSREEEIKEMRKYDIHTDYSTETKQQALTGLACSIEEPAIDALFEMARGRYNYLQFRIELGEERIYLEKSTTIDVLKLPAHVPSEHARYHLFLFKHTHEGDFIESFIFIYSMPGYSCSVKERMMYSSCKGPFVESIQTLGIEIARKLEIDSGSELTEEFLYEELHPKKTLHKPLFAKPKGPPNRGNKRLTKIQD